MTDYTKFEVDMEDLSRHDFGGLGAPQPGGRILLGVCAMEKKANSKPMKEILALLEPELFEMVFFPEPVIVSAPITSWPRCHALISFYSDGFPLDKAVAYAELYRPFLVNELKHQHLLKDRRHVMKLLDKFGVPTPEHVEMNRGSGSPSGFPVEPCAESDMQEFDDYIVIKGKRLDKPFVEKPVDGDDHNVIIYYPRTAGGGSCRLFRKVKDRSSNFFPDENSVRRQGSYMYETFLRTEGSDVKVYTVSNAYAHSEARKSPSIDGVVSRNEGGYEIRYPVLLTPMEKEIATHIVEAFGQRICGFDVLRSDTTSFVCDVNGWSFVKNNDKYYMDFALILGDLLKRAMGLSTLQTYPMQEEDDGEESEAEQQQQLGQQQPSHSHHMLLHHRSSAQAQQPKDHEELRCVIAVVRHGDRTPKQKLKINAAQESILELFDKYSDRRSHDELKLKTAAQLTSVLKVLTMLIEEERKMSPDPDDLFGVSEELEALLQAKSVLEMHGTFKGINRKVQLKPVAWRDDGAISACQFILKWGGVLTLAGREQAEQMGESFRQKIYPYDGLLRLHSTYRHDLKVYSSNEGRVQVTAAAFAKGLLQLDGHLTPILASLVRKSDSVDELLDEAGEAKAEIEAVKARLHHALMDPRASPEMLLASIAATEASSVVDGFKLLDFSPRSKIRVLHEHIGQLVVQLRHYLKAQRARFGLNAGKQSSVGIANTVRLLDPGEAARAKHVQQQQQQQLSQQQERLVLPPPQPPHGEPGEQAHAGDQHGGKGSVSLPSSPRHLVRSNTDSINVEGGSAAASLDRSKQKGEVDKAVSEETGTALLMSLYRWTKLDRDLYSKKKDRYDLSKIPDIYDSVKYDLLHNPQLNHLEPPHLSQIFTICRALADIIVPQEYGITEKEKKSIGSKIGKALVAKIQNDLISTVTYCTKMADKRDEQRRRGVQLGSGDGAESGAAAAAAAAAAAPAIAAPATAVPPLKTPPPLRRDPSVATISDTASVSTHAPSNTASTEDDGENFHRLDKRHARKMGIKSRDRMVRTRLYFTSESHLHSLLNVLRYAAAETVGVPAEDVLVDIPRFLEEAEVALGAVKELNYLTHIVFRLFEIIPASTKKSSSPTSASSGAGGATAPPPLVGAGAEPAEGELPPRFRVTVSFSPGVPISYNAETEEEMEQDEVLQAPDENDSAANKHPAAHKPALPAAATPTSSWTGQGAEINLEPCTKLIPLFQDLECNKLNHLFNRVLRDVSVAVAEKEGPPAESHTPPTSPKLAR